MGHHTSLWQHRTKSATGNLSAFARKKGAPAGGARGYCSGNMEIVGAGYKRRHRGGKWTPAAGVGARGGAGGTAAI